MAGLFVRKFDAYLLMRGAACFALVFPTLTMADLGHNHADHDRAFLAWAASLKASDAASGPQSTQIVEWSVGEVLSIDSDGKWIKIRQKTKSAEINEVNVDADYFIGDLKQLPAMRGGLQVRFRSHLLKQVSVISEIDVLK